jgi:polysaccharide biosynthesis protein PslH
MTLSPREFPLIRRPKILLLAPFLYGEKASHGGAVLCWAQLRQLAQTAELAFVGFSGLEDAAIEAQHLAGLAQHCSAVHSVPLNIQKSRIFASFWTPLLRLQPGLARLCHTPAMVATLQHACRAFAPDVVWIQFPQMAQYIAYCPGVASVMDVQDAHTLSAFRKARHGQGWRSIRNWFDWMAWTRYEAATYARFNAVLTLSDQDAHVLRAMNPAVPAVSMGLPWSKIDRSDVALEPMRVGFAGSFGHPPNVDGLRWFLQQVWPKVLAREPQARLIVAGRNPPPTLTRNPPVQVQFIDFVPSILDFYAANTVTIVPLVNGGGVKIKTIEAMLAGGAVVSTRIGVEGLQIQPGKQALVQDDAAAFAEAVLQALEHAASAIFSADAWRDRIQTLLQQIHSPSKVPPP